MSEVKERFRAAENYDLPVTPTSMFLELFLLVEHLRSREICGLPRIGMAGTAHGQGNKSSSFWYGGGEQFGIRLEVCNRG